MISAGVPVRATDGEPKKGHEMSNLIYAAIASLDGYIRGRGGEVRLGRAGRRGARVRQRPRALARHLPLRPEDVRDDGRLGHGPEPRGPLRGHARLRRGLAGRGQDRLLAHARSAVDPANADRAGVRSRGRATAEGVVRTGRRRRRPRARGARVQGRPRRRNTTCSSHPSSSAGASAPSPTVSG